MMTGFLTNASMVALLAATSAGAQIVPDTAPAPSLAAAAPAAEGIADIVVTAQRRSESLQRTALAVTVVGSDDLVRANITQPQDLTKLVPALKLSATGGAGTQVTIRGVGNFAGNPYAEPAVAINLDGVYLARSGGSNGLFYDLERVEVLKGPQGTLYGRNATAGAINLITKKPTDTFGVEGSLEGGNYNYVRGVLAVNVPLAEGVALRASGTISRRDGYLEDGYLDDRTEAARLQLLLEPSSDLTIRLSGDFAHLGGKGPNGVVSPYLVPGDPFRGSSRDGTNTLLQQVSLGITGGTNPNLLPPLLGDGFVDQRNWGFAATIDYDFGPVKLTVIPAYRRSENRYLMYNAGFPVNSAEDSKAKSIEARLASNNGSRFTWLIGGYYYDEDQAFTLVANQGVAFSVTAPKLRTKSYAAFGQGSFALSDTFRVIGGIRYTDENKTQRGTFGLAVPPAAAAGLGCLTYVAATGVCTFGLTGDLGASKVTYKAGIEYDAAARSLVYANVATGFKAGGFYGSQAPNTFAPETLTAYTIGSKNRFADNTLQVNLEAFYWDYKNQQITHVGPIRPVGFTVITENAGKARIYGAEADLVWTPTRADTLRVNVQYLDTKYTDLRYTQTTLTGPPQTVCPTTPIAGQPAVTVDCSGRRLNLSPTWTANLSYAHSFPLANGGAVDAQAGSQLQSYYFTGIEYLPGERQKAVTVSNATLTYRAPGARYTVGAFVDNIENSVVKTFSFVQPVLGVPIVVLKPPRTFGGRLTFKFD